MVVKVSLCVIEVFCSLIIANSVHGVSDVARNYEL